MMSQQFESRVKRYSVTDEEISDFLFEISTKELCLLVDKVIMTYVDDYKVSNVELDKMIDIAAYGFAKKYLTNKQKWCIGSFCLYFLQQGETIEIEEDEF